MGGGSDSSKPLPLCRSGRYARFGLQQLISFGAAGLLAVCCAVGRGGVDPVATLAFLHLALVVFEQTLSLQWPHGDLGVLLLVLGALAIFLAPVVVDLQVHLVELRVVSLAWSATTWFYMVRGPGYELRTGSMEGKVCLVTGSNTGIGFTTARAFARAGGKVIVACRSEAKSRETILRLLQDEKSGLKESQFQFVAPLDLSSIQSVRDLGRKFALLASMTGLELHLLVLNAGAMFSSRKLSVDGVEMTFATNHLGHFLLTHLLLPQLKAAEQKHEDPRVIIVSSSHSFAYDAFDFSEAVAVKAADSEEFLQRPFDMFHAYGQSKFANLLFATELVRRLRESKSKIPVCVLHPGSINTEIARDLHGIFQLYKLLMPAMRLFLKSTDHGCVNTLFAAASPSIPRASADTEGFLWINHVALESPNEAGTDARAAKQLWVLSEKLTGIA
eukprot:TRINITY_DN64554_c0_g1_i1.p1 TRINITY_DN64554_c0_g1~~TRINITY_DN64554_c0_g1_i1.p1  ORF type:complete len:458 (+),score=80.91 TRINITY_DN64554_c0_g1_i1:41-1375(+)